MSADVILLNTDYQFHAVISRRKAIQLIFRGKCEVIVESTKVITFSEHKTLIVPKVLRLLKMVKSIFTNTMPYSKKNVSIRDEYTCQYCGKKNLRGADLTLDHVLPKSRGGHDRFENCVCSCAKCNTHKADSTPEEANMRLLKVPKTPSVSDFIHIKAKSLIEELSWDQIMKHAT